MPSSQPQPQSIPISSFTNSSLASHPLPIPANPHISQPTNPTPPSTTSATSGTTDEGLSFSLFISERKGPKKKGRKKKDPNAPPGFYIIASIVIQ